MLSRNPLKSGQAFKADELDGLNSATEPVAIPSNRVKRSKATERRLAMSKAQSRNPLKSGQAFKE